ncbi:hypothetical protein MJO29_007585 [Puccinia striiformis f. sp. tritici]|nr:hypothetical protein MJO29_007585 [Puccinia striiformis f. sp. tritici]
MDPNFLSSIQDFTSRGLKLRTPSSIDVRVLEGWERSTLRGHNSAVRKFLKYKKANRKASFDLPASPEDIYGFCAWAGRGTNSDELHAISAATLTKYIGSLKAWHVYHDEVFPPVSGKKIGLMIKGSAKADARMPKVQPKGPVMVPDLIELVGKLVEGSEENLAVMDLVLVAFWGMGRLGELTYEKDTGDGHDGPQVKDVWFSTTRKDATIAIRNAKTAAPGELQYIRLAGLKNILCPVMALERRCAQRRTGSLFSFQAKGGRRNLTKYVVTSTVGSIWKASNKETLSGHSFRVGGASLRNALRVPIPTICRLGRWESSCYKLYLRFYTATQTAQAVALLESLTVEWSNEA